MAAVPGLGSGSRVLDVGSGTGALIPHLQAAGVVDILAADLSEGMLGALHQRFRDPGSAGNEPGVSCTRLRDHTSMASAPRSP